MHKVQSITGMKKAFRFLPAIVTELGRKEEEEKTEKDEEPKREKNEANARKGRRNRNKTRRKQIQLEEE